MDQFLAQVLQAVHDLGGLAWVGKIAVIVTLIVSSMKVSLLNDLIWSKLGPAQVLLAPALGLVGGVLSLSIGGQLSLPAALAYMSAGAGAIILHQLLDSIKCYPGVGPLFVSLINLLEGILGGSAK